MATNKIPTMLRLPEDLHRKIKSLAQLERRSVNAEIEFALSTYIADYEAKHGTIPFDSDDLCE